MTLIFHANIIIVLSFVRSHLFKRSPSAPVWPYLITFQMVVKEEAFPNSVVSQVFVCTPMIPAHYRKDYTLIKLTMVS